MHQQKIPVNKQKTSSTQCNKKSPDGVTRNQIDHTLVRRKFRNSIVDTRVLKSADIGSDHFLLCTAVKLKLMKVRKEQKKSRRINKVRHRLIKPSGTNLS